MKNRYKIFLLSVVTGCLVGCNNFLDVLPTGKTVTETVFADMKGMKGAVAGMYYKTYQLYTSSFYAYPDVADNLINLSEDANSTIKDLYNFTTPTSSSMYWGTIYDLLVNINNIIEYQPSLLQKNPGSRSELEIILGEALFMRALSHFNLCNAYAQSYNYTPTASHLGITVVLRAPNYDDKLARDNVAKVYSQVLADLNTAEQLLTGKTSRGVYYANLRAVYALKSRVYLYMGDWDNCITYSTKLIDEVPLAQNDDYISMYTKLSNPEKEVIFRLNGALNQSTFLMSLYQLTESYDENNIQSVIPANAAPSNKLLDMFAGDPDDIRYSKLIYSVTEDQTGNVFYATAKFDITDNTNPTYAHFNPIVFRCSEMYLNRAEAHLNNGDLPEAAADIKAIIARAHNKPVGDITVTETDADELLEIIQNERIKELCFEGHKLFDTNRWKTDMERDIDTSSKVQKLTYPSDYFVLPIPQRELDVNPNMVGNPTVNE